MQSFLRLNTPACTPVSLSETIWHWVSATVAAASASSRTARITIRCVAARCGRGSIGLRVVAVFMSHRPPLRLGSRGAAPLLVAAVHTGITLLLAVLLGRGVPRVLGVDTGSVAAARGEVLLVQAIFRLIPRLEVRLALGETLVLLLEQAGVHAVHGIADLPAVREDERGDEERKEKECARKERRPIARLHGGPPEVVWTALQRSSRMRAVHASSHAVVP